MSIRRNSELNILAGSESGITIFDGDNCLLVYDDECIPGRRRFTIAHELGHILLGHELINGIHGQTFNMGKSQYEREADMFAARLLAPACVLWGLNLHAPEEIARICNISMAAAKIRAERMALLYKRYRFLTSPLERDVYEQFREWIGEIKTAPP